MTRVCIQEYPKGFSNNVYDGFYMDTALKMQLDILARNIINDWDFTFIVTGRGEVRVGKSVLAMQIGAYWYHLMKALYNKDVVFSLKQNWIFDGTKLIEQGNKLGNEHPFSCLLYDEAGADLSGLKMMRAITQDVLDYYRECGQYNMLNILVLPDFFDLPKAIAVTRSTALIDVDYEADRNQIFRRGKFKFYSRPNKKMLYLKGKKELDYNAWRADFKGRFTNFYPIDEGTYRQLKKDALEKREMARRNRIAVQRDAAIFILNKDCKLLLDDIGMRINKLTGIYTPEQTLSDAIIRAEATYNARLTETDKLVN